MYYDSMAGGTGVFFSPYNSPFVYGAPILSVDDTTLHEYIRKQM